MLTHEVACNACSKVYTFELDEGAFQRWQDGAAVHEAFPHLLPEERELFLRPNCLGASGMCGQCWKDKFSL